MEREEIKHLIRGLDIIARDMNTFKPINILYIVIGLTFLMIWLAILIGSIDRDIIYVEVLYLVSGLVGYSTIYAITILVIYTIYRHIDYVTYYLSHLNDILKNTGMEGIDEDIEKISLTRRLRIEYSLLALAVGLLSLLSDVLFINIVCLISFMVIIAFYLYMSLEVFHKHMLVEKGVFMKIYGMLNIEYEVDIVVVKRSTIKLISSLIPLTILLVFPYVIYTYNQAFDTHTADHRIIHKRIKSRIIGIPSTAGV